MAELDEGNLKPVGWKVPAEIFYDFKRFCASEGYVNNRALAGAMLLFRYLPTVLRAKAIRDSERGELSPELVRFWQQFEAGIDLAYSAEVDRSSSRPQKPEGQR